jgi:hypothetical protein
MKRMTQAAIAAILAAAAAAATAQAAPPANVANTTWTLRVDGSPDATLFIDTQAGAGAPGNSVCRALRGNLEANVPVRGWYCPTNGRFHLLHENKGSRLVMRVFLGTLSDPGNGQPLRIEGATLIDNSNFGDLGEVEFSAEQQ